MIIEGENSTQEGTIGVFLDGSTHKVGPVWTGTLPEGNVQITLRSEDFGGNIGTDSVQVERVPHAATLVVESGPLLVIPRMPGSSIPVPVKLEETFPGSLNGHPEIEFIVTGTDLIRGRETIRDELNQPEPEAAVVFLAVPAAPYGLTTFDFTAREIESQRVLDVVQVKAIVAPNRPGVCTGGFVPFYQLVDLEELTQSLNQQLNALAASDNRLEILTPMTVTYRMNELRVSQRYRVSGEKLGINFTGTLNLVADLRPQVLDEVPKVIDFQYSFYSSSASPDLGVGAFAIFNLVKNEMKRQFDSAFRERFRKGLGDSITDRMNSAILEIVQDPGIAALVNLLLSDVYINPMEFAIGLCLPPDRLTDFT